MKKIIGFAIASILIVCLMTFGLKSSQAQQEEDAQVKVGFRCRSMVGVGEMIVLFEGRFTKLKVECGGPSI